MDTKLEKTMVELKDLGYESAVAVATKAEVESGAACGQLALISEASEKATTNS